MVEILFPVDATPEQSNRIDSLPFSTRVPHLLLLPTSPPARTCVPPRLDRPPSPPTRRAAGPFPARKQVRQRGRPKHDTRHRDTKHESTLGAGVVQAPSDKTRNNHTLAAGLYSRASGAFRGSGIGDQGGKTSLFGILYRVRRNFALSGSAQIFVL